MKNELRVLLAASRLLPLAIALVLTSCATKPTANPPALTPAGDSDSDIDLMMAKFAKAVHVIANLNENGEVTYQELLRVAADADDEKFRAADLDESGGLSLEETTVAITKGEAGAKLRRKFDPNHDGIIDPTEAADFEELIAATEGLRKFVDVEEIFAR